MVREVETKRLGQSYLDFDIEITGSAQERNVYNISVLNSPGGEVQDVMHFPFSETQLESHLKDIKIALLRSVGVHRLATSPEERIVKDFGEALFNAIMTRKVCALYDSSQAQATAVDKGLRLKLRIKPPQLASLPWEFMYDSRQGEYVCLSINTPMVRYIDVPQPVKAIEVVPPLKILGMVVSPANLPALNVSHEKRRLDEAIRFLKEKGLVELTWMNGGTWRDLQRVMWAGPWHIFHFIGHGAFDRHADEGVICLEDENGQIDRMSATQLGRALSDHRTMRLVVLNSCEGACGSQQDIFSSTASVLVRRGIPAVLAMQYEITDRAAIEFSTNFYEALACGLPVDAAASAARKAISFAMDTSLEWAIPVLFMRSQDGMLFDIDYADIKPAPVSDQGEDLKKQLEERRKAREAAHKLEREKVEAEKFQKDGLTAQNAALQKAVVEQPVQKQAAKAQPIKYLFPAWSVALVAIIFGASCLAAAYFLLGNPFIPVPDFPTIEPTMALSPPIKITTRPKILPVVFTVTSTYTAVPSLTSIPTEVFIATASIPPLGPTDPADFVVFYFDTILKNRDYDLGWSLLTSEYISKNELVKQKYIETWSVTDRLEHSNLNAQTLPLNRAIVDLNATFYYTSGTRWQTDLKYCMVRDESRNTWMIDTKSNCGL